jgi:hypothetical protein
LYAKITTQPPRLVVHCGIPDDGAFGNYSGPEVRL